MASVAFFDSRVADIESLIAALDPGVQYFVLDAETDGIGQIVRALNGISNLDSLHIVSHGASGTVYLGSTVLTEGLLEDYRTQLSQIGASLSETGDILLYGCDVGTGDTGESFIEALARFTGADVAASTDTTGSAALGGDWVLEQSTGAIESTVFIPAAAQGAYAHTLATITGGSGNDNLIGTAEDDLIIGLGGDDTLVGGAGRDDLYGDAGNDMLDGGAGYDIAHYDFAPAAVSVNLTTGLASGGDGSDVLTGIEAVVGSSFNDTLTGSVGDDQLIGFGGNDVLSGGNGRDILIGDLGNDTIDGGPGNGDEAGYYSAPAAVVVNLATGVASGGDGSDTLLNIEWVTGSSFNDTLTGSAGNDVLVGRGGNDQITGGSGDDSLWGEAGDDTFIGFVGADTIDGGTGWDTIVLLNSSYDLFVATDAQLVNVEAVSATSAGAGVTIGLFEQTHSFTITGSAFNDTISGSQDAEDTVVYGGVRAAYGIGFESGPGGPVIVSGPEGTDTLEGIEWLQFSDVLLDIYDYYFSFPNVSVVGNGLYIADGDSTPSLADHTDFGAVSQGGAAVSRVFTVNNSSNATLTTSGLALPPGFSLVEGLSTSIATWGSDTFTVRLDTAVAGTKSGQISFNNNDSDENPFNFSITGTVNPPVPEIGVSGNGQNITDGDNTPSITDYTDFGSVTQGGAAQSRVFTVSNTGNASLTTSGLILPSGFSLAEGLSASIAAGGFDTFTVRLDTAVAGTKSGQISFNTNDSDENPFNFSIAGTVNTVVLPVVSISPLAAIRSEGNSGTTPFTFTVTRTGNTSVATTVDWAVGASATSPSVDVADFTTSSRLVVDFDGTDLASPDVAITSFSIRIGGVTFAATNSAVLSSATNVAELAALINAVFSAQDTNVNVTASGNTMVVADALGRDISDTVPEGYLLSAVVFNGSFSASATFYPAPILQFPSGTISFLPGEAAKTLTVDVTGDALYESGGVAETFIVTLSNPSGGATIGTATASGSIQNDDAAPAAPVLSISPVLADRAEGNSGTTDFTFTVARGGSLSGSSTANWVVSSSAATGTDFVGGVLPSGSVSFAPGEFSKPITVPVAGDTTVEPDESFTVMLTGVSGATLGTAAANGTIVNDDAAVLPVLSISPASADKPEGNGGTTNFTFNVSRSGDTSTASSANWAVSSTAATGTDFVGGTLPSGSVSFGPGETSKQISVPVAGDTTVEPDESFTVTLYGPSGATLTTASAVGRIQNDDAAVLPVLSISPASADEFEGNSGTTAFTFTVSRTGDASVTSSVNWARANGASPSADAADFSGATSGVLTWGVGDASAKTITLNVVGDTIYESGGEAENFVVTLSSASGATLGNASASGRIRNDDASTGSTPGETIIGGSGDDSLPGGPGDDTLEGRGGNDTLNGGPGSDTADYSTASGPVTVNLATRIATGASGTDTLISIENAAGGNFNDTLIGDSGPNVLTGRRGNDTLQGGAGIDTANYAFATGAVMVDLTNGIATGADDSDSLSSIENATGSAFADTLIGSKGANMLDGRGGVDRLEGGKGDDTYYVDNALDLVVEALESGGLLTAELAAAEALANTVNASVSYVLSLGVRALRLEGEEAVHGVGNDGANEVDGNAEDNSLSGLAGNDVLGGGAGSDTLLGGTGNDTLYGGAGNDTLYGGRGNDTAFFIGAFASYTITPQTDGSGAVTGYQVSSAAEGVDFVFINVETLSFSDQDVPVDQGTVVNGTSGNDTLTGTAGNNQLYGGKGNDTLDGGGGADYLEGDPLVSSKGGSGADSLMGGSGNDTLLGGSGNDILNGGAGIDGALYGSQRSAYTVSPGGAAVSAAEGNDTLISVERLAFSDRSMAFDLGLGQAAGDAVRVIGAAFDAGRIVSDAALVGNFIDLFDAGMSMQQACAIALGRPEYLDLNLVKQSSTSGTSSNLGFVNAVYFNVVGHLPSPAEVVLYVGLLEGGGWTQVTLLEFAANHVVNELNINVVGLQQTGVEFM